MYLYKIEGPAGRKVEQQTLEGFTPKGSHWSFKWSPFWVLCNCHMAWGQVIPNHHSDTQSANSAQTPSVTNICFCFYPHPFVKCPTGQSPGLSVSCSLSSGSETGQAHLTVCWHQRWKPLIQSCVLLSNTQETPWSIRPVLDIGLLNHL